MKILESCLLPLLVDEKIIIPFDSVSIETLVTFLFLCLLYATLSEPIPKIVINCAKLL